MLSSHMTIFSFHAFLLCLVLGTVIMITQILFITFHLLQRPRGAFMPLRLAFDPKTWNRAAQHSQFLAGPGVDFRIQTIICLFLNNRDFFVFSSTCIVTYRKLRSLPQRSDCKFLASWTATRCLPRLLRTD